MQWWKSRAVVAATEWLLPVSWHDVDAEDPSFSRSPETTRSACWCFDCTSHSALLLHASVAAAHGLMGAESLSLTWMCACPAAFSIWEGRTYGKRSLWSTAFIALIFAWIVEPEASRSTSPTSLCVTEIAGEAAIGTNTSVWALTPIVGRICALMSGKSKNCCVCLY